MIDIIFNSKSGFSSSPNYLIEVNNDYKFMNNNYGFGNLSKTNVFIGENNSGKSRFLRYVFETNYYSISKDQFNKFITDTKNDVCISTYIP